MNWKREAEQVVQETLAELPDDVAVKAAKKALSDAYPFGVRDYAPYDIWLAECRRQLALRFPEVAEEERERNNAKLQRLMKKKGLL